MRYRYLIRITVICISAIIVFAPVHASAAVLKRGSSGAEVKLAQAALKDMGYFKYPEVTGYFGSITEAAVKLFQKDNGILPDGKVGNITKGALYSCTEGQSVQGASALQKADPNKSGSFDWFSTVQYIWKRGMNAVVTDVDTGKSFRMRRSFGTNHADVEPISKMDTNTIKVIWGGWTWDRHAVIVQVGGYTLAGSMSAMPHAGVDNAPAEIMVSGRSGGYGKGQNLDAVKNNGVSGVMDLHFLNSRTHGTNIVKKAHQEMVEKAAEYIAKIET